MLNSDDFIDFSIRFEKNELKIIDFFIFLYRKDRLRKDFLKNEILQQVYLEWTQGKEIKEISLQQYEKKLKKLLKNEVKNEILYKQLCDKLNNSDSDLYNDETI